MKTSEYSIVAQQRDMVTYFQGTCYSTTKTTPLSKYHAVQLPVDTGHRWEFFHCKNSLVFVQDLPGISVHWEENNILIIEGRFYCTRSTNGLCIAFSNSLGTRDVTIH